MIQVNIIGIRYSQVYQKSDLTITDTEITAQNFAKTSTQAYKDPAVGTNTLLQSVADNKYDTADGKIVSGQYATEGALLIAPTKQGRLIRAIDLKTLQDKITLSESLNLPA